MEYKGLTLDQFQVDSIRAIDNNHSVVVSAPTGSGKTLIADYIISKYLGDKIIYTAPIKALSNQKYKEFSNDFGKDKVGLLTGDIVINPEADVLIMTTEIYRNMALINDRAIEKVKYVIFDEIHYINDIERGYVWEESIIFSQNNVRFLCLSATIPNAKEFASWIIKIKKHKVDTITCEKRSVPLHKYFYDTELGICSLEEIREVKDIPRYKGYRRERIKPPNHIELVREIKNKLPCFFFNFSRQGCQELAVQLSRTKMFKINPKINNFVRQKLRRVPPEIRSLKSTKMLMQTLPYGIAFHHAGLIPIVKEIVEELFGMGMINVLYCTETFAVGINMPAKTVCFKSLRKFDGINFRSLNSKEYFQIAGRAGRRGIDTNGFVYAMVDRRDFDYGTLKYITSKDLEPIRSHFRLSINTVLNLVKMHSEEEIKKILTMSFFSFQRGKGEIRNSFNKTKKKLIKLGYIKDNVLTEKGEFSSRIYADEILIGEIFATKFYENLNEYQMLLIIGSLCYEHKEKTEFYKRYHSGFLSALKKNVRKLPREKRFDSLNALTALIYPCYRGENIFKILKYTNLVEGDLIRFFRQMLDRFSQIKKSTRDDKLRQIVRNCQELINDCLSDIDRI